MHISTRPAQATRSQSTLHATSSSDGVASSPATAAPAPFSVTQISIELANRLTYRAGPVAAPSQATNPAGASIRGPGAPIMRPYRWWAQWACSSFAAGSQHDGVDSWSRAKARPGPSDGCCNGYENQPGCGGVCPAGATCAVESWELFAGR